SLHLRSLLRWPLHLWSLLFRRIFHRFLWVLLMIVNRLSHVSTHVLGGLSNHLLMCLLLLMSHLLLLHLLMLRQLHGMFFVIGSRFGLQIGLVLLVLFCLSRLLTVM